MFTAFYDEKKNKLIDKEESYLDVCSVKEKAKYYASMDRKSRRMLPTLIWVAWNPSIDYFSVFQFSNGRCISDDILEKISEITSSCA